jgi:dihydrofolate reductase
VAALLEYAAQVSLDGFIEDSDGNIEWTEPTEELHRYWNAYAAEVEGFLMGRRLYEAMVPFWPDVAANPTGQPITDEFASVWMSKPRIVFSRTLETVDGGCRLESRDLVPWAGELRRTGHGLWSVGNSEVASTLLSAGLLDRIRLTILPVVLGTGKSFLRAGAGRHLLRASEYRDFPGGERMLLYEAG